MKKKFLISFFLFLFLLVISFCKEDIYGNIKLSFTIGNYLQILKIENLLQLLSITIFVLLTILIMIFFLLPFVNYLISLKKRKQQIFLLLILLPLSINAFYKDVYLIDIHNNIISLFVNLSIILMPFITITMFFILKEVNNNEIAAAKDLGANNYSIFRKIIIPKIKMNSIYWLCFYTLMGSNIILLHNNNIGNLVYTNISNHIHIPYICAIICLQYVLFITIIKIGGIYDKKNN